MIMGPGNLPTYPALGIAMRLKVSVVQTLDALKTPQESQQVGSSRMQIEATWNNRMATGTDDAGPGGQVRTLY